MARNWLHRFGSKQVKAAGFRGRSSDLRRRWQYRALVVQALEARTLLAVTASVNSSVLDVNLSAANDSVTISFDRTNVDVSGTGLSVAKFSPAAFPSGLSVTGASLSNQSVTFTGLGSVASPISLGQMVSVTDVTSLNVTSSGFSATGNVSFQIADSETGTSTMTGTTGQASAAITISSSKIQGDNITINAAGTMTASSDGNGISGANLANVNVGSNSTIAIDPTSPSTGSQIIGTGNVAIAATSTAMITASAPANAPSSSGIDAAVANSSVTSTAITHISGSAKISAGDGLSVMATNTTNATVDGDGTGAGSSAAGGTVAVSIVNTTTQAYLDGSATAKGSTVTVSSTSTTTAATTAKSTPQGATQNDPATQTDLTTYNAKTSDGAVGLVGALAVTDLTRDTEAYIASTGQITGTTAININSSSTTNDSTTADGSATNGSTGVGVAVAIDLAHATNEASIQANAKLSAPAITVQALTPGVSGYGTQATSGPGGTNVGVAGAVAINLVSNTSDAAVTTGNTLAVSSGDNVTLHAQNNVTETASALPSTGGSKGSNVGVGASLALNVATNTAQADLENTAQLTGAAGLTLGASSSDTMTTMSTTGAASKSGVAVSPAVAISIASNTTTAQIGSGSALTLSGTLSATATHTGSTTSTAGGTTAGSSAAIGASVAITIATDETTATTASNITAAGDVSFVAAATVTSAASGTASASGGNNDDGKNDGKDTNGNNVDSQNTAQRNFADTESDAMPSVGAGDSKGAASTPSASTSDGQVSVAAAVSVNIANSEADATIPSGLSITSTGGALTLSATNTTSATSTASGNASGKDQVGVGAAVALNLATASDEATIQSATGQPTLINTQGVSLNAGMTGAGTPMNSFTASATSGAGGKKATVGVAGSVAINIVKDTSQALIETGTSVTAGGGDVSLTSVNNSADTATAVPSTTSGPSGTSVGVGGSLALNIISDTTQSEVQDGAALTGAGNVTVTASSPHTITTTAKNGAAGSVAVGAGIAIVIASEETTARIGSDTQTLNAAGTVTIGASGSFTVVSQADADAADQGGSVGVGATVVVNDVQDSFLADLDRNVTASGAVSITATATASGQATAKASENGTPSSDSKTSGSNGTADQETANQATFALSEGGSNAPSVAAPPSSNSQVTSPSSKASTASGGSKGQSQVGVAAAVSVNVITTSTVASIENSLTVTSGGLLTVGTTNQSSANALANGQAETNHDSVGAAVALNVASATNNATIGSSDIISAHGMNVTALETSGQVNDFTSQGLGEGNGKQVGVAGSVGINVITVNTQASIGAGTHLKSFGGLAVESSNFNTFQNIAFTLAVGADTGAGAAVAVNDVNDATLSFIDANVQTNVADLTQVTAESSFNPSADSIPSSFGIPDISKLHPTAFAAGAGATSGDTGVAGSFIVNVINETTTAYINNNVSLNTLTGTATYPTASSDQGVTVSASDTMTITDWAGGVGGGTNVGVGSALDVDIVTEDTQAYISDQATIDAAQNVAVESGTNGTFDSVTAAAGLSKSVGIAGTASIEVLTLTTNAYIDHNTTVDVQGSLLVQANHQSAVTTLAGQLDVGGNASVGAAVSTVADTENTDAYIGTNDTITAAGTGGPIQVLVGDTPSDTTSFTGVAVTATAFQTLHTTAVGGSASLAGAIAGSVAVNDLKYTTLAYVAPGANITATDDSPGNGPGVMVTAADLLTLLSTSGALAAGADAGLGAGVDIDSITKNTQAYIATATVTTDGNVLVQAISAENLTSVTGAVGLSGDVAIAGSAGVYVLGITTRAFIGDDPDNPTSGATTVQASGNILVAASEQTMLNILTGNFSGSGTASVGASAGVPIVTKTTEAFIGAGAHLSALGLGNGIEAENGQFDISYAPYTSSVGVAQPKPISANLTGSGNNLTSPRLTQERVATPVTVSNQGLAVTAVNSDALQGVGVDGGVAGTVAANLSGSVAVLTNHTDAYIGAGAVINASNSGAGAGQSVLVAAGNDASFLGIAAALSISGTASITPGVVVVVINNTTTAAIDDGAVVVALGNIEVQAHSSGDVLSIAASGAVAGTASVGGSVSYVGVNDTTWAYIGDSATTDAGGAQASAGGNVLVDATDDTVAYLITGSLSVGASGAGVGGAVGIALLDKDTKAFIGSHATVNALANGSSLPGIFSGNFDGSPFGTDSQFYGIAVQAATSENVTNVAAAGAGGFFAGLAGGVSVEIFNSDTQAFVGHNAQLNASSTGASSNQAVNVSAVNQATNFSFAGGLGGGIAGIAGGVDVGLLNNSTQAFFSNGSDVHALGYIAVSALSDDTVQTYALGAAVGIVGLVGSVSVWSIGDLFSAGYTDGNASDGTVQGIPKGGLSGSSTNAEGQAGGASALIGSLTDPNNNGAAGNTQYLSGNISSAQSGLAGSITGDPVATAVDSTAVPKGTVAFIGSGVNVTSGGVVTVIAQSQVDYSGVVGGLSAGVVGIGGSVDIANIDANTQSYMDQNSTVSAASSVIVEAQLNETSTGTAYAGRAGIVGVGAQVVDIQDGSTVSAKLNSGVAIPLAGGSGVEVTAASERSLTALALGGDFGGVAAGVGVAIANATGGSSAAIAPGAQIGLKGTTDDSIDVEAGSDDTITAESYGVAAGYTGATGVYASASSNPSVAASISGDVNVSGSIYESAYADDDASATALGVTVAAAASLGAAVALADVSPTISAEVGSGAQLTAGQSISVLARQYQNSDGASSMAGSGAGAILVGAAGSDATSTASPTVDSEAAAGASLTAANDVSLEATSNATALAQAIGAGLGVAGVGISIATATDGGSTDAHSDANVNLTGGDDVSITSSGVDTATADSTAGSGGIVSGDGADGTATIDPTITATTGNGGQIDAVDEVSVVASITPTATADVMGVSAGALAVGASVANATDSPSVTATAGGAGTTIMAATLDAGVATYLPTQHENLGSVGGASFPTNSTETASANASGSTGAL